MVGSEESWSPGGPDGSPVAADPSACLTSDKAGEGKSAKLTGQKDMSRQLTLIWFRHIKCDQSIEFES